MRYDPIITSSGRKALSAIQDYGVISGKQLQGSTKIRGNELKDAVLPLVEEGLVEIKGGLENLKDFYQAYFSISPHAAFTVKKFL